MAQPISYRAAVDADLDFLWNLHRAAFQEYVDAIWGWDDADQEQRYRNKFDPAGLQVIQLQGQDAGVLWVEEKADHIYLDYIAILPQFRNQGVGTQVVRQIIATAAAKGLPVALQVLRGNPARRLYERLGFVVTEETAEHFRMARSLDRQHGLDLSSEKGPISLDS